MSSNNEAKDEVFIGSMKYLVKKKDKVAQDPRDRVEVEGVPKQLVNIGGPTHGYKKVKSREIIIDVLKEMGNGWDHGLH